MYTLGTAAKACGVAKSTIHRAIKAGRISARSLDSGGYAIDPAELHRVFPPVAAGRLTTPAELSVPARLALAETEIEGLRRLLEAERERSAELRIERDRWHGALEANQRLLTDQSGRPPPRSGFFRRLFR